MRLAKFVALAIVLVARSTHASGVPYYKIGLLDCQEFLMGEIAPDAARDARAERAVAWIAGTHPVVQRLFAADLPLETKFDLFFLTTGYVLPPPPSGPVTVGRAHLHYGRATRFYNTEMFFDTNARARRQFRKTLLDVGRADRSTRALDLRLRFLSDLAETSFTALDMLIRPQSRMGYAYESLRAIRFETPWLDFYSGNWKMKFTAEWPSVISATDLDELSKIAEALRDKDVRHRVILRLNRILPKILEAQQDLCTQLHDCIHSEGFASILANHPLASELTESSENHFLGRAPEIVDPEPDRPSGPSVFDAGPILNFVATTRPYRSDALNPVLLDAVWTDLQTVTELTNDGLFALQSLRATGIDWRDLSERLRPNIASVDETRQSISKNRLQMMRTLHEFTSAETAYAGLGAWLVDANEFIGRTTTDEAKVMELPPEARQRLLSVVSGSPLLSNLVENTLAAVRQRRRVLSRQVEVIQGVNLLIGGVAYGRVIEAGAPADLAELPAYRKLHEDLRLLADVEE